MEVTFSGCIQIPQLNINTIRAFSITFFNDLSTEKSNQRKPVSKLQHILCLLNDELHNPPVLPLSESVAADLSSQTDELGLDILV